MARKYGVHSAMPAVTAKRLCPHAISLPSRIDHYAEVSSQILEIFGRFTPLVEPLSLDEAFLDVTGSEHLWQLAHGIDDRSVVPAREAKSISHETTFEQDIDDQEVLRAWLLDLTEQVAWRIRRHELRGRVVHLKVRFADFSMITRSQTLPEPTDITDELWQVADEMLRQRLPADHLPVRLLGMGVSGFDASGVRQRLLFDHDERQRQADLDATTDQIRERFGSSALHRAASLPHQRRSSDDGTNPK